MQRRTSLVALIATGGLLAAFAAPGIGGSSLYAQSNDNFANREAITGASGTVLGSNVGATKEANEPDHAGNPGGASVWWSWTSPRSGEVSFNTQGSVATGGGELDTLLAVYGGEAVDSLVEIAANDDSGAFLTSLVTFDAVAESVYQIAVDGFLEPSGPVTGDIVLSWQMDGIVVPGTGQVTDPYILPVSGGGFQPFTIGGIDDWIYIENDTSDPCFALRVIAFREDGGDAQDVLMQFFDERCPPNGPGTFPRLIAANYTNTQSKDVVLVNQTALDPVLLRVYPRLGGVTPNYGVSFEVLPSDDSLEPNDVVWEPLLEDIPNVGVYNVANLILRDDDWFLIPLEEGESVTASIFFNGFSGDLNMQMFDLTNYVPPAFPTDLIDQSIGFGDQETITYTADAAKTVGLRVYGERGSTNIYNLSIERPGRTRLMTVDAGTVDAATGDIFSYADEVTLEWMADAEAALVVDDGSDQYEPNQFITQAAPIPLGTGMIEAVAGDEDWYAIEQELCGTLELELEYDADTAQSGLGIQIFTEFCPPNGPGTFPQVVAGNFTELFDISGNVKLVKLDQLEEPEVFVRIYRFDESGPFIPYSLTIRQIALDDDNEDNDVPWDPTIIANPGNGIPTTISQILRDDDWFEFTVPEGQTLAILAEFNGVSGDVNLQLYDGDNIVPGAPLPELLDFSFGFFDTEEIFYTGTADRDKVLLRVYGERGSTNIYDLTYTFDEAP